MASSGVGCLAGNMERRTRKTCGCPTGYRRRFCYLAKPERFSATSEAAMRI